MWWYRKQREGAPEEGADPAQPTASALVTALGSALSGHEDELDRLLAMSLIVDSHIETADGLVLDSVTWGAAEKIVQDAAGGEEQLKLYNTFARDFRDGYSTRDDLPEAHAAILDRLRTALLADPGVTSITEAGAPRAAPAEDDDSGELSVEDFIEPAGD